MRKNKKELEQRKNSPWSELIKPGIIIYVISYLLLLFIYFYFCLPFYSLRSPALYLTIIFVVMLPLTLVILYIKKYEKVNTKETKFKGYRYDKFYSKFEKTSVTKDEYYNSAKIIFKNTCIILSSGLLLMFCLKVIGFKIFNSQRYYEQLNIAVGTNEELNATFDYEDGDVELPNIDKELAAKLAQAKLDEYGAQYSIDIDNFTIISVNRNGKTELLRVTPLEYENVFVSLSRMHKGTIGYIEVNVVTKEAKLVKFDESNGLKYMPSGVFKYDLDRHLRTKYPTSIYSNKYFEIDDEGNPYWVIPTVKREIGVFDGSTPSDVILVNPITGHTTKYKLGTQPSWVQRCVDERLMEKQTNNALSLKNGFWNRLFAKKEVFQLSDGYNYLLKDNATYYISCITSPNENDQTSIGFLIINLKTKEAIRYSSPGITEMRAREIAMYDERVKAQALDSTWPILVSYHGVPTYFVVLKNDVQAQKIVFINVETGESVGMGNNVSEAKLEYDSLLLNKDVIQKEDKMITGYVTKTRDTGQTIEFMIDSLPNVYFSVDVNLSLDARFLQVGDYIDIVYKEYATYNLVEEITRK